MDQIITIGHSSVQHGPYSDRVYLMHLDPADCPGIMAEIKRLAETNGYSKIFAKVPESLVGQFHQSGYATEALVPGFFPVSGGAGRENGHFLALYLADWRSQEENAGRILDVLRASAVKGRAQFPAKLCEERPVERMESADAVEMAAFYDGIFASYPFPINDPDYIRETMETHVVYYGLRRKTRIVALSSCEIDAEFGLVEMTDFAADPRVRGKGVAFQLLEHMEREMRGQGCHMAYTIARAGSFGMNITFARHGYQYAGTLLRNTFIAGALESMNVWWKPLRHSHERI